MFALHNELPSSHFPLIWVCLRVRYGKGHQVWKHQGLGFCLQHQYKNSLHQEAYFKFFNHSSHLPTYFLYFLITICMIFVDMFFYIFFMVKYTYNIKYTT